MTYLKEYSNGLRLIVVPAEVRSVTLGVWVRAGSAYETPSENGISHFIEHMMFKGTAHRNAFEISKAMDDIGAQINAFTSREYTCYYTKSVDEDAEKCFELLSEMLYESTFPQEELERERQVVLEEIAMVEDSPEDVCQELLTTAVYGDGAYGRTILGKAERVATFTAEDIRHYMAKRYVPTDFVIVVVGNMSREQAEGMVSKYFDTTTQAPTADKEVLNPRASHVILTKKKQIEQTGIAIAFPSLVYDDPQIEAMQLVSTAVGGGMSSRLFQEVRERQGLAYAVYAYLSAGLQDGSFAVYCGTNAQKVRQATETMLQVLRDVRKNGLSQDEFLRSKAQMRGGYLLGQESTYTLMNTYGKYMIQTDKLYDRQAGLEKLLAVTQDDCRTVIENVLDFDRACMAIVGEQPDDQLINLL